MMKPLDQLRAELSTIERPRSAGDPLAIWNRARVDAIVAGDRRLLLVNRVLAIVQMIAVDAIAATLVWPLTHDLALTLLAGIGAHAVGTLAAATRAMRA